MALLVAGCTRAAPPTSRPTEVPLTEWDATTPAPATPDPGAPTEPSPSAEAARAPRQAFSDDEGEDDYGRKRQRAPLDPATAYLLKQDTVIMLHRTACFGPCPQYSVGITAAGDVHFYGEAGTASLGYQTAPIGRPAVQSLLAFLEAKHFHSLHARYTPVATDHRARSVRWRSVRQCGPTATRRRLAREGGSDAPAHGLSGGRDGEAGISDRRCLRPQRGAGRGRPVTEQ